MKKHFVENAPSIVKESNLTLSIFLVHPVRGVVETRVHLCEPVECWVVSASVVHGGLGARPKIPIGWGPGGGRRARMAWGSRVPDMAASNDGLEIWIVSIGSTLEHLLIGNPVIRFSRNDDWLASRLRWSTSAVGLGLGGQIIHLLIKKIRGSSAGHGLGSRPGG